LAKPPAEPGWAYAAEPDRTAFAQMLASALRQIEGHIARYRLPEVPHRNDRKRLCFVAQLVAPWVTPGQPDEKTRRVAAAGFLLLYVNRQSSASD